MQTGSGSAHLRIVQSRQNPRLRELRAALRSGGPRAGSEPGLIALEGPHLVEEALRSGLRIHTLFVAEESSPLAEAVSREAAAGGGHTEVLVLPRALLCSALGTVSPQPVAALAEPPGWSWQSLAARPSLVLVLAGLQDPGNTGTVIRSAEAFGADAVLALPGTAGPWNGKALRASAGSAFRLPVLAAGWECARQQLRARGLELVSTGVHEGIAAADFDLRRPLAIVLGSEGAGVPAEIAAAATATLRIPTPGPVESLNAAVAAGILLYEVARQRGLGA
jgi:TrmH family RNA methyltransferase